MKIISKPKVYQTQCLSLKKSGTLGFIPTMGCLHEGHLALIKNSVKKCDFTAVSIFVNPLQFGPKEDFTRYPRPLKRDLKLCNETGVDLVFVPKPESFYGANFSLVLDESKLSLGYCGKSRPGHFSGVVTVVAKLLNCTQPDFLWMGQKDYQQCRVLKRLIDDLNFPITFKMCETVREKDGLAMSSRNRFLSEEERKAAPLIYAALKKVHTLRKKEKDPEKLARHLQNALSLIPGFKIDYATLADRDSLLPATKSTKHLVALIAGFMGKTRLIDNILL